MTFENKAFFLLRVAKCRKVRRVYVKVCLAPLSAFGSALSQQSVFTLQDMEEHEVAVSHTMTV